MSSVTDLILSIGKNITDTVWYPQHFLRLNAARVARRPAALRRGGNPCARSKRAAYMQGVQRTDCLYLHQMQRKAQMIKTNWQLPPFMHCRKKESQQAVDPFANSTLKIE
ncbi:hypothetical protein KCP77_05120 [Salmonella enterica subsp. enterica]|nr:hypothetical protein KCP77_05120 [Salmonella enterica subsp. enterica]